MSTKRDKITMSLFKSSYTTFILRGEMYPPAITDYNSIPSCEETKFQC